MSLFGDGFKQVQEESKKQEQQMEQAKSKLWEFYLTKDNDEADVIFLTDSPVNFEQHQLMFESSGKTKINKHICTAPLGKCSLCDSGAKTAFKSAFLVVDRREFQYTDKKTNEKKTGSDQVRLYVVSAKVCSQIERITKKYGLLNRQVNISRTGVGTSTQYMIDRGEELESPLSEDDISSLLPDALKEKYDGTQDSLKSIIHEQLLMTAKDDVSSDGTVTSAEDDEPEEEGVIGIAPAKKSALSVKKSSTSKPVANKSKPKALFAKKK